MKKSNFLKKIIISVFALYIIALVLVLIFKFPTNLALDNILNWEMGNPDVRMKPQLVPFKTITFYISRVQAPTDWFFKNLMCNIIIFIPYGFLLPFILSGRKNLFLKTVLSGMIVSCFIEVFQYISTLGECDIDDLILNTISTFIGYFIYRIVIRIYKHKKRGVF